MGRRRRRRNQDEETHQGHQGSSVYVDEEGKVVNVRKIGADNDGVLYTMQISVSLGIVILLYSLQPFV